MPPEGTNGRRTSDAEFGVLVESIQRLGEQVNELGSTVQDLRSEVQTVSQRQMERTLPCVEGLEKIIHGNGKIGLLQEHAACKERLVSLQAQVIDLHDKVKEAPKEGRRNYSLIFSVITVVFIVLTFLKK